MPSETVELRPPRPDEAAAIAELANRVSGELSGEVFVADVEALAHQVSAVLVAVEDEQQRLVSFDEPAEPAPGAHGVAPVNRQRTALQGAEQRDH